MNNRQRANGIALGILSILLGVIILVITFPKIILTSTLIIGSLSALYYIGKALRNTIEDHLDEEDANEKWKQDKNIK
jgi:hypothetical protein